MLIEKVDGMTFLQYRAHLLVPKWWYDYQLHLDQPDLILGRMHKSPNMTKEVVWMFAEELFYKKVEVY